MSNEETSLDIHVGSATESLFLHFRNSLFSVEEQKLTFPKCTFLYFNRFWFFKIAAIVGIMVGSFYIPGGHFATGMLLRG